MKLSEKLVADGDRLIHARTFDAEPHLDDVAAIRSATNGVHGENRHIARVSNWLVKEWLKEAGVSWSDPAANDVIKRKLLSGEVGKLRVWGGTY